MIVPPTTQRAKNGLKLEIAIEQVRRNRLTEHQCVEQNPKTAKRQRIQALWSAATLFLAAMDRVDVAREGANLKNDLNESLHKVYVDELDPAKSHTYKRQLQCRK